MPEVVVFPFFSLHSVRRFEKLGIARYRVHFSAGSTLHLGSRLTFVGCNVPHAVHPVLLHGFRKLIGVSERLPCQERDTVFLILRNGTGSANPGRRLVNIAAVEARLRAILQELSPVLGVALKLRLLNTKQVPDRLLADLARARVLLGPHGGGLYNLVFAPKYTAVVEITTAARLRERRGSSPIFWRIADAIGQPFFMHQAPFTDSELMSVDLATVETLTRAALVSGCKATNNFN